MKNPGFKIMALVVLGICWDAANEAAAAEQRCNALGANCVCSEPLNTPTYNPINMGSYTAFDPADSTTKECAISLIPKAAIISPPGGFVASNEPVILSKFPTGHTISWLWKQTGLGIFNLGHWFADAAPTARRSVRAYVYISPDFQFTSGSCTNSGKIFDNSDQGPTESFNGHYQIYAWPFWSVAGVDCCWTGPGQDAPFTTLTGANGHLGKVWRIEWVMRNLGGTPVILQNFWTDVTPGSPTKGITYTAYDTSIPQIQTTGDNWTSAQATTLSNNGGGTPGAMTLDMFRTGTCAGYYAVSHILYAAWSTDAGQMIGAACEVEGGCGGAADQLSPSKPTGLKLL